MQENTGNARYLENTQETTREKASGTGAVNLLTDIEITNSGSDSRPSYTGSKQCILKLSEFSAID